VRGFNLFAAFIGMAMIAVAVGYSMYAQQAKVQRINEIATEIVRLDTAGVSEVIKSDVYNTILSKIRDEFQDYFENTVLEPPPDAWESRERFKEWFENEFAQSEPTTYWVADRMMVELQAYTATQIFGEDYEVSVIGNVKATANALKGAVRAKIQPDGTFVYIIDTTKMAPEAYGNLPKIMVRKHGEVSGFTTDIVLPRGLWMIPVPLRIMKAYDVAKEARDYIHDRKKYQEVALAMGHCDQENLAVCDVFQLGERSVKPLSFEKIRGLTVYSNREKGARGLLLAPCTYQNINYLKVFESTGTEIEDVQREIKKILEHRKKELEEQLQEIQEDELRERIQEEIYVVSQAIADLESRISAEVLRDGPCRGDKKILFPLLDAVYLGLTREVILESGVSSLYDETGVQLVKGLDNFSVRPDTEQYREFETAKIVRRRAINLLKIICEEVVGPVDIILQILGFEGGLCGRLAEGTGSVGTISLDGCTISGSAYCVAPEKYAYIVSWGDPNEKYRIDPDRPATFHFRIVEGDVGYVNILKGLETAAKKINVGSVNEGEQEKRKREICAETWNNAKEALPKLVAGCLQQYVQTAIECAPRASNEIKTYILTGIPPDLQEYCQNCGPNCEDSKCMPEKDPVKAMEGVCKRLEEHRDVVPEIPGVFRNGGSGLPDMLCAPAEGLSESTKKCLEKSGVDTSGNTVCTPLPIMEKCFSKEEKQRYARTLLSEWGRKVKEDLWYCDPYTEGLWKGIQNVVNTAIDRLNSLTSEICQRLGIKPTTDIVNEICRDDVSITDAVKTIAVGPAFAIACTSSAEYGKMSAKAMVSEYNHIYHKHIVPLIHRVKQSGGWGACTLEDDVELNAFIQAFSEPEELDLEGGQALRVGGNCHPDHLLDQAFQIADMRARSISCKIEGPSSQVLFETTWVHIGSDIYATCSVGEPRP